MDGRSSGCHPAETIQVSSANVCSSTLAHTHSGNTGEILGTIRRRVSHCVQAPAYRERGSCGWCCRYVLTYWIHVVNDITAWPYGEPANKASDIDLFIHGLGEGVLWAKVGEIADKLKKICTVADDGYLEDEEDLTKVDILVHSMSPGLVTFTALYAGKGYEPLKSIKIQVILRSYSSISAILHAFDVPSCCVAYDGRTTFLTTLGAYAQAFRVNIVHPAYRSTTYEARLLKYFDKGYALVLPNLRIDAFVKGQVYAMPHLLFHVGNTRGYRSGKTLQRS